MEIRAISADWKEEWMFDELSWCWINIEFLALNRLAALKTCFNHLIFLKRSFRSRRRGLWQPAGMVESPSGASRPRRCHWDERSTVEVVLRDFFGDVLGVLMYQYLDALQRSMMNTTCRNACYIVEPNTCVVRCCSPKREKVGLKKEKQTNWARRSLQNCMFVAPKQPRRTAMVNSIYFNQHPKSSRSLWNVLGYSLLVGGFLTSNSSTVNPCNILVLVLGILRLCQVQGWLCGFLFLTASCVSTLVDVVVFGWW